MKKGFVLHLLGTISFTGIFIFIAILLIQMLNNEFIGFNKGTNPYLLSIIFLGFLFEFVVIIFLILGFWKCDLKNKWFKTTSILNILLALAFILVLVIMFMNPGQGTIEPGHPILILLIFTPIILLISSILFLMGYFKNRVK